MGCSSSIPIPPPEHEHEHKHERDIDSDDDSVPAQVQVQQRGIEYYQPIKQINEDLKDGLIIGINAFVTNFNICTAEILKSGDLDILRHIVHIYDSQFLIELNESLSQNIKKIAELTHCIDLYSDSRTKLLKGFTLGELENIYIEILECKSKFTTAFEEKVQQKINNITVNSSASSNPTDMLYLYNTVAKIPSDTQTPSLVHITTDAIYSNLSHYAMTLIEEINSTTTVEDKIAKSLSAINNLTSTLVPYLKDKLADGSNEADKLRAIKSLDDAIERIIKIIAENTVSDNYGTILKELPRIQHERYTVMYILKILVAKLKLFYHGKLSNEEFINVYNSCETISLKYIDPNIWNVFKQPAYRCIQLLELEHGLEHEHGLGDEIQQTFEVMVCESPESYGIIKKLVQTILRKESKGRKDRQTIILKDIEVKIDDDQYDETDWKQRFIRGILPEIYNTIL